MRTNSDRISEKNPEKCFHQRYIKVGFFLLIFQKKGGRTAHDQKRFEKKGSDGGRDNST